MRVLKSLTANKSSISSCEKGIYNDKTVGYLLSNSYENHANFIVNDNNATSTDVSKLMKSMYNKVKEKHNICLKPEIKYFGVNLTKDVKELNNKEYKLLLMKIKFKKRELNHIHGL